MEDGQVREAIQNSWLGDIKTVAVWETVESGKGQSHKEEMGVGWETVQSGKGYSYRLVHARK